MTIKKIQLLTLDLLTGLIFLCSGCEKKNTHRLTCGFRRKNMTWCQRLWNNLKMTMPKKLIWTLTYVPNPITLSKMFVISILQPARFEAVGECPSNVEASKTDAVQQSEAISALQEQLPYATVQIARNIAACHHEKWDGTGYPAVTFL